MVAGFFLAGKLDGMNHGCLSAMADRDGKMERGEKDTASGCNCDHM
jgi:hypothetical protein